MFSDFCFNQAVPVFKVFVKDSFNIFRVYFRLCPELCPCLFRFIFFFNKMNLSNVILLQKRRCNDIRLRNAIKISCLSNFSHILGYFSHEFVNWCWLIRFQCIYCSRSELSGQRRQIL